MTAAEFPLSFPDPENSGQTKTRPACAGSSLDFHSDNPAVQAACQAICRHCPVAADCFAGAVERDEPCGVWGGVTFGVLEMATADELVAELLPVMAGHTPSRNCYAAGCREPACSGANARYVAERRRLAAMAPPKPRRRGKHEGQGDLLAEVTTGDWVRA